MNGERRSERLNERAIEGRDSKTWKVAKYINKV